MNNPKTAPPTPQPVARNGWIEKWVLDDYLHRHLPIPTQVVSNEEYYPLPQTPQQKAVEHHLIAMADANARRLALDRRRFLRTACGMATAFAAMNKVFGDYFRVEAAEMLEPAAAAETKIDYFIFDVQTHHVRSDRPLPLLDLLFNFRRAARPMNPALRNTEPKSEDFYLANYVKEIFLDSDTDVAALSGVPSLSDRSEERRVGKECRL